MVVARPRAPWTTLGLLLVVLVSAAAAAAAAAATASARGTPTTGFLLSGRASSASSRLLRSSVSACVRVIIIIPVVIIEGFCLTCATPTHTSSLFGAAQARQGGHRAGALGSISSTKVLSSHLRQQQRQYRGLRVSMSAAASASSASGAGTGTGLVWFKCSDLRTHDHEPLSRAHAGHAAVCHLFCVDPRWFGEVDDGAAAPGTLKTGPRRAQFLLEAVEDLRARLRAGGSDLVVKLGRPEVEVPRMAVVVGASAVYAHRCVLGVVVTACCVRKENEGDANTKKVQ